ncbi:unnamed protein product [Pleuronectes platessa]|uniref:Secreted protein n=1 Tax=Pleuronectes platessa TaxID=8262 RepID=A0A9N7TWT7_PLEPL|nr:unnamed protein product [Pleuronectes platessa]
MNPLSSLFFLNTLSASLPITIHCLPTENTQPRAVQSSRSPAKPRCGFWGQRRRMRAEKLKREACEVLRFRSHKYPQEEKPRQSACDTSAETRLGTGRGVNNSAELLSRLFVKRCQKRLRTRGVLGGESRETWWEGERRASGRPVTLLSITAPPLQTGWTPA